MESYIIAAYNITLASQGSRKEDAKPKKFKLQDKKKKKRENV